MAMTPEEYAAKELAVPGWENDEPLYAPGVDPNIAVVLAGGAPSPEFAPAPAPGVQATPDTTAMTFEYNFVLPLQQRRAELVTEVKKHEGLDAKTRFWESLTAAITAITGLIK